MQAAAELTHIGYADEGSDVLRGDEWRDPDFDEKFRIMGSQLSTNPDVYIRVECELVQSEPTNEVES
jgi:hypothetical protein